MIKDYEHDFTDFKYCEPFIKEMYFNNRTVFDNIINSNVNDDITMRKEILKLVVEYGYERIFASYQRLDFKEVTSYIIDLKRLDECRTIDGKKLSEKQMRTLDMNCDDLIKYISTNTYSDISNLISSNLEKYKKNRHQRFNDRYYGNKSDMPSDLEMDVYGSSDWIND